MYATLEEFEAGVVALLELVRDRDAVVLVNGAPFGPPIRFEFDPGADDVALFRAKRAPTQLLFDITEVASAILVGETAEGFVEFRSNPPRDDDVDDGQDSSRDPEPAEIASAKYELVASRFPIADLQRRLWTKTTAKHKLFGSATWEVVRKYSENETGAPFEGGTTFGTLKLFAHDPDRFYSEEPPRFSLMVDEEDVTYLIEVLEQFRKELQDVAAASKE